MITAAFTKEVLTNSGFYFNDDIIESIIIRFNRCQGDPECFIDGLDFIYGPKGYSKETFSKVYDTLDDILNFHFSIR